MKKVLLICLAVVSLLFALVPAASASVVGTVGEIEKPSFSKTPEIMPLWNNTSQHNFYFTISPSGTAMVKATYNGTLGFSYAKLTVKLQKRFMGLFWSTVDIGYTDNEWVAQSSLSADIFSNTFYLEDTGTYRAKITLEVFGTDGSVDTIEETLEYKYE